MSPATETAERILDAAAELFATHGYSGTTTRAIAASAGVNEVTVFRRFESKAGVLRALVERIGTRAAGRAAETAAFDSDDVRETLEGLARLEIAGAIENGGIALRLAYEARSVPEIQEILGEGVPSNLDGLAEYLAEQQVSGAVRDDVDPRVMAEAFFGLTSSYVMYRVVMGVADLPVDIETNEGIEQLFDLFWSGAAAKEGV